MATLQRKQFKILTIYGWIRSFSNQYTIQIPIDIIKTVQFFYVIFDELTPPKSPTIEERLLLIAGSIWYSTRCDHGEKGMVEYDIKSEKIMPPVSYPFNIRPANHACCSYNDKIYIINGWNREIIEFDPKTQTFAIKKAIPDLGSSVSCIVIDDNCHIFNGDNNDKHLVYSVTKNILKRMEDTTATSKLKAVCVLEYQRRIIKFGGRDEDGDAVGKFWISSEIEGNEFCDIVDIKWTLHEEYEFKNGIFNCGYILVHGCIVVFGGSSATNDFSDEICVLDLRRDVGWVKTKHIRCPMKSQYRAVLDDDGDVHLITRVNKWPNWKESEIKHYCIGIKQVFGDI